MVKRVICATLLASASLTGCVSTTMDSTAGVNRKQLLLVSSEQVDQLSIQSYNKTLTDARSKKILNTNSAEYQRLQRIANRIIPQVRVFRPDAAKWAWEANLIKSDELNAYCAPGGKIMFYTGIIERLNLTDDEIAAIMGHEMAHALREHGREQVSREYAEQMGLSLGAQVFGLTSQQAQLAGIVTQVSVGLPHSRTQETEADSMGLELMARAGYNPQAAVSLWHKMDRAAQNNGTPQFLSTHPASSTRVQNIEQLLPRMMPLYQRAK